MAADSGRLIGGDGNKVVNIPRKCEEYAAEESKGIRRTEAQKVMVLAEIVVVFVILLFCFRQRTPREPIPVPTETPTPTMTPTFTPSPSPSPTFTPTPSPSPTPSPIPYVVKEVEKGHPFKPMTGYWAYNAKGTAQHALQKAAKTDERTGIRVVTDPLEVERYCVALGTYWCGGHPEHIGRCLDVYMVNGAVLHCVLADVKKQEDTKGGKNRYGKENNDILEFIVDERYLPKGVYGDISDVGSEFEGDVSSIIVYDEWIEGFGEEWKR